MFIHCRRWPGVLFIVAGCWAMAQSDRVMAGGGELRLTVLDQKTGEPVPCRLHLKTSSGKPRAQKPLPFWHDHFVIPGKVKLRLPRGQYTFEIERGPEYTDCTGYFIIDDHADDEKTATLTRAVDMAAEGWWSADMHVHRPRADLKQLMEADDLHIAVLADPDSGEAAGQSEARSATFFGEDRFFYVQGEEDSRWGNHLIYFTRSGQTLPSVLTRQSAIELLQVAKLDRPLWVDVSQPYSWDLPILVALGLVDSIDLASDHVGRKLVNNDEGQGRHRDVKKLPPPFGNALWSQQIYYHLLNCGLRITPTAGSGSGIAPNPIGYNRVYAYAGEKLDESSWWQALAAGQVMVTNGPLIRPHVRGQVPGAVFTANEGETLSLDVSLSLSTRDRIGYLEIIKNGAVERAVPLDEWAKQGGRLAPLVFKESGWFLIRAVTDVETTYRFASTGAYYVEIGSRPKRISRESAKFFLDWTRERAEQNRSVSKSSAERLRSYEKAIAFWEKLAAEANAP